MAKHISLIGSQDVVALNLKSYMFHIMQRGFDIRHLTGETQLLEYITIRHYFLSKDTKYCFQNKAQNAKLV